MNRAIERLAAALLLLCACTSGAVLRVRPPPAAEDDAADAQRARALEAVRDVGSLGGLRCEPPSEPGPEILGCWPDRLGGSPAFVSLHLRAADVGYEVGILESFGPFSRPRQLCSIQDRLAERFEVRLPGAAVERDPRVTCPRKGR